MPRGGGTLFVVAEAAHARVIAASEANARLLERLDLAEDWESQAFGSTKDVSEPVVQSDDTDEWVAGQVARFITQRLKKASRISVILVVPPANLSLYYRALGPIGRAHVSGVLARDLVRLDNRSLLLEIDGLARSVRQRKTRH